jgi:hypothetical protein
MLCIAKALFFLLMKFFFKQFFGMTTAILILCIASMPVFAKQTWQGSGEIIRGVDRGGSLELLLVTEDNLVEFLSGPSENLQARLKSSSDNKRGLNGSVETDAGVWQFEQFESELKVTLYQRKPYRVILYLLHPS